MSSGRGTLEEERKCIAEKACRGEAEEGQKTYQWGAGAGREATTADCGGAVVVPRRRDRGDDTPTAMVTDGSDATAAAGAGVPAAGGWPAVTDGVAAVRCGVTAGGVGKMAAAGGAPAARAVVAAAGGGDEDGGRGQAGVFVAGRGIPSPWLARRPQGRPPYHRGHLAEARGDDTPVAAATLAGGGAAAAAEEVAVMHGQAAAKAGLAAAACCRGGQRGGWVALGAGLRIPSAGPTTTASAAGAAAQVATMAARGGAEAGVAMAAARGVVAAAPAGDAPTTPVRSVVAGGGVGAGGGGDGGGRPKRGG